MIVAKDKIRFTSVSFLLSILFAFQANAQDIFDGQVMDKLTQTGIPSVTISLLKQKVSIQSNDQGYFKLQTETSLPNDTLVFSSVGYLIYKLPVSKYLPNAFIMLTPSNVSLEQVEIDGKKLQITRINAFGVENIKQDFGYIPIPFSTQYAYAKLFNAPTDNSLLLKIELGRTSFEARQLVSADMPLTKSNPRTRFLIHVMSVNAKTLLPEKILLSKTISLDDNSSWISVDLGNDKLALTDRKFFIVIEWLRVPYNEIVKLEWAPRVRKINNKGKQVLEDVSQYKTLYQPALVVYAKSKAAQSYIKNKTGSWIPAGRKEEVALSATLKY